MSARTSIIDKLNGMHVPQGHSLEPVSSSKANMKRISEMAWGGVTFLLFLALGPFSAVAALLGLASLAKNATGPEPKSVG